MFSDFALTHAWLIPLLPALAFLVIGFFTRLDKNRSAAIAITMSSLSFLLACGVTWAVVSGHITMEAPFVQKALWFEIGTVKISMGALVDPMTAMMLMVVTIVSLLVQIYSVGYMAHDPGAGRFFAFLSLFAASMLGLVIAVNFAQMYVFWELVGLCSYLLIGFYYNKISAREAAKKAFIKDVKIHVDAIASKYIRTDEGTFDFALMYIPAENVYYETVIKDTELGGEMALFNYALTRRVIPVSPNSFYAYLQTILLGLKGLRVEERAREIMDHLDRLNQETTRFTEAFRLVGDHLDNASKKYEEAQKRLARVENKMEQLDGLAKGEAGQPGSLPGG